jgi:hypothetical protein
MHTVRSTSHESEKDVVELLHLLCVLSLVRLKLQALQVIPYYSQQSRSALFQWMLKQFIVVILILQYSAIVQRHIKDKTARCQAT